MRKIICKNLSSWPESWQKSYAFDLQEIYGQIKNFGYYYHYLNRLNCTIKMVEKYSNKGKKILDVAAAQGNFSLKLAEKGYDVTWNDIREDLIDYVKMKLEFGKLNFVPGNIFDLRFKDKFDVVLSCEIIEHVSHPDLFLKKIGSFVKKEGYIILTTPNRDYFQCNLPKYSEDVDLVAFEEKQFKPDVDGHLFAFSADDIERLAGRADLKFIESKIITNFITNGHIKTEILLKVIPKKIILFFETLTTSLPMCIKNKIHTGLITVLQKR